MTSQQRTHYITVDSIDRDRTLWNSSSHFEVKFDPVSGYKGAGVLCSLRNVISIELVDAVYPYTDGISHLYLRINEINGSIVSSHNNGEFYFAKLVPKTIINGFVYTFNNLTEYNKRVFNVRGTRIDKLTIELVNPDGTLASFGNDTAEPNVPNPALQTSFTFKVVTEDAQRY